MPENFILYRNYWIPERYKEVLRKPKEHKMMCEHVKNFYNKIIDPEEKKRLKKIQKDREKREKEKMKKKKN